MNVIEKSMYFGLGLFSYSKDMVESAVQKMVNTGEVPSKEAQGMVNDLVEKGKQQRQAMKMMIREVITEAADLNQLAKKQDVISREELRQMIREEVTNVLNERG